MPHGTEEGEVTDDGASANSREAEREDRSSVVSGGESTSSRAPDPRERCFIEWLKEVPGSDFPDETYLKIIEVSPLCRMVRCSLSPFFCIRPSARKKSCAVRTWLVSSSTTSKASATQ